MKKEIAREQLNFIQRFFYSFKQNTTWRSQRNRRVTKEQAHQLQRWTTTQTLLFGTEPPTGRRREINRVTNRYQMTHSIEPMNGRVHRN